ncbi:MAG TPA: peptidase S41 [Bacteroidales bacterium]|nr:peptidase S41 [Bacteroidales bacterium]
MWTNVYNKYSFFELKNIDWLAVKNKYAAQIDTVKTEVGLFDVLASTLNELQDGHVNIFAPFDFSRSWSWYLNYPQNFNKYILERNYLGTNYRVTGALTNQIINGVGYIRYSSFENGVSGSDLDFVLKRFADLPGIIIDVRDNGGGSPLNAFTIASRFTTETTHVYSSSLKNGPGQHEFSPSEKVYLSPYKGINYTKKVVILTNRLCYSATNLFVAIMSNLPNATIIGDTTGGGGGIPVNAELPNGWTYRFSATVTTLPNGQNIETGIAPTLKVDLSPADEAAGIDTILETAINFIKNSK